MSGAVHSTLAATALALLLSACQSAPKLIALPFPPLPRAEIALGSGDPQTRERLAVYLDLTRLVPARAVVTLWDERYFLPDTLWIDALTTWVEQFLTAQLSDGSAVREYVEFHPHELAMLLDVLTDLALLDERGEHGHALIGVLGAKSVTRWGRIGADGTERLHLVVGTPDGFVVLDLYTRQKVSLREFPNLAHVTFLTF